MSQQPKTTHAAVCAALIAGLVGCATTSAPNSTRVQWTAPPTTQVASSPALLRYLRRVQQQLGPRCAAELDLMRTPTTPVPSQLIDLDIPIDPHGQLGPARVLSGSGDAALDERVLAAVASVRYLPALPAALMEHQVSLRWQLTAAPGSCATQQVRVVGRPMPPSEALRQALALGHYLRAQEIVQQTGAHADVIRVLQRTIESRRARGVAMAAVADASVSTVETLLAQAVRLAIP